MSNEFLNHLAFCRLNSQFACSFLFPDLFYTPFSNSHKEIFEAIDSGAKKIAIAAPRGIGKTTIARAITGREVLLRQVNFITYISNSATSAEMQTENLKAELLNQDLTKMGFGDIRINEISDLDESFSKKTWSAYGSTLILPRGAGQQIRGLNWHGYRPQLFIIDDLENSDEVTNELNRAKLKNWFFSDVMKSVNRYRNDWRFIYIDTIKHEDSLLSNLLELSDWTSVILSLCDDDYNTNFPEYMTTEEIKQAVEEHREAGTLDVFYREMMNKPISTEDAVFLQQYFKYYDETDEEFKKTANQIENVVIVDPAKTVKLHSADSAIVCLGLDMLNHRVYFRDCIAKKLHPDEIVKHSIEMCVRWRSRVLAVEVTGLNEFITHPFKTAITASTHSFARQIEFIELKARKQKEDRIAALAFYYRKGEIFHNRTVCGPLEAQLLSFPRSKRFDVMDATAYVVELMEQGERYFHNTNESDEPEDDETSYPTDDAKEDERWRCI